jgi:hypothetical protein
MAVRDKLVARAAPFLGDREVVQQAFRARVMVPGTRLARATYVVIGTEDAVVILKTSNWSTSRPTKLVARVPKTSPMTLEKQGLWSLLHIGEHYLSVGGRASMAEVEQLLHPA